MTPLTIYPAIDLRNGQVVRLQYGDPRRQTTFGSDPLAAGQRWIDAGAAWITVDLRENQLGKVNAGDPARVAFDAVPGRIFDARVQSVAWGINPGRDVREGLVVSKPDNRWFEPARRIPVRLELEGGVEAWPRAVPVGGKVHAIVLAEKGNGVLVWIARASQRLRSWFSFLH